MKIINNNLIVNEEESKIILIGDTSAALLSCTNRDLEECVRILQTMIGTVGIVSMDAEDICSLHHPGKTVRVASAVAKGESCVQEVCRKAFLNMEDICDTCILLTVPASTDLDVIEENMSFLSNNYIHPDASIVWSVIFSEDDTAALDAIIF